MPVPFSSSFSPAARKLFLCARVYVNPGKRWANIKDQYLLGARVRVFRYRYYIVYSGIRFIWIKISTSRIPRVHSKSLILLFYIKSDVRPDAHIRGIREEVSKKLRAKENPYTAIFISPWVEGVSVVTRVEVVQNVETVQRSAQSWPLRAGKGEKAGPRKVWTWPSWRKSGSAAGKWKNGLFLDFYFIFSFESLELLS